jgi:hypothetical protein
MNKFKVLSIEAWADGELDTWSWNQWFDTGYYFEEEIDGELTEESALKFYFLILGYNLPFKKFRALYETEDDQYNIVLVDKSDRRPLYAIEYGNQY